MALRFALFFLKDFHNASQKKYLYIIFLGNLDFNLITLNFYLKFSQQNLYRFLVLQLVLMLWFCKNLNLFYLNAQNA